MPDWLVTQYNDISLVYLKLPLTTQWAVTLLVVAGIIVHVFSFNDRTVHDGPSVFTTAGIFFTFLGIAQGLYNFDAQQIEASVPNLLEGLKTAFAASVFGVGIALSIKLRFALLFNRNESFKTKEKFIRDFSLSGFFEEFDRSPVWAIPHYDSTHAPTNIYSVDFYKISKMLKERRGYICEDPTCRRDLSKYENQRFLHAHHLNGNKSDNRQSNIKLLCIRCHSKVFQHAQLRELDDYKEYCKRFRLE